MKTKREGGEGYGESKIRKRVNVKGCLCVYLRG